MARAAMMAAVALALTIGVASAITGPADCGADEVLRRSDNTCIATVPVRCLDGEEWDGTSCLSCGDGCDACHRDSSSGDVVCDKCNSDDGYVLNVAAGTCHETVPARCPHGSDWLGDRCSETCSEGCEECDDGTCRRCDSWSGYALRKSDGTCILTTPARCAGHAVWNPETNSCERECRDHYGYPEEEPEGRCGDLFECDWDEECCGDPADPGFQFCSKDCAAAEAHFPQRPATEHRPVCVACFGQDTRHCDDGADPRCLAAVSDICNTAATAPPFCGICAGAMNAAGELEDWESAGTECRNAIIRYGFDRCVRPEYGPVCSPDGDRCYPGQDCCGYFENDAGEFEATCVGLFENAEGQDDGHCHGDDMLTCGFESCDYYEQCCHSLHPISGADVWECRYECEQQEVEPCNDDEYHEGVTGRGPCKRCDDGNEGIEWCAHCDDNGDGTPTCTGCYRGTVLGPDGACHERPPTCGLFQRCDTDDVDSGYEGSQVCCGDQADPGYLECRDKPYSDGEGSEGVCDTYTGRDGDIDDLTKDACYECFGSQATHDDEDDASPNQYVGIDDDCMLAIGARCPPPDAEFNPDIHPAYCAGDACRFVFAGQRTFDESDACREAVIGDLLHKCFDPNDGERCGPNEDDRCLFSQTCCGQRENEAGEWEMVCSAGIKGADDDEDSCGVTNDRRCGDDFCGEHQKCCMREGRNGNVIETRCVREHEECPEANNCSVFMNCDHDEICCGHEDDPGYRYCSWRHDSMSDEEICEWFGPDIRPPSEFEGRPTVGMCKACFGPDAEHGPHGRVDPRCIVQAKYACWAGQQENSDSTDRRLDGHGDEGGPPEVCFPGGVCDDLWLWDSNDLETIGEWMDVGPECRNAFKEAAFGVCVNPQFGNQCGDNKCSVGERCCGWEFDGEGNEVPLCRGQFELDHNGDGVIDESDDECPGAICGDMDCAAGEECCAEDNEFGYKFYCSADGCHDGGDGGGDGGDEEWKANCGLFNYCDGEGWECCHNDNDPGYSYCYNPSHGHSCKVEEREDDDPLLCKACASADVNVNELWDYTVAGSCAAVIKARCGAGIDDDNRFACQKCFNVFNGDDSDDARDNCVRGIADYTLRQCTPGFQCGPNSECLNGQNCCGADDMEASCSGFSFLNLIQDDADCDGFDQHYCGEELCGSGQYCCNSQNPSAATCKYWSDEWAPDGFDNSCPWAGYEPNCGYRNRCDFNNGEECCGGMADPGRAYCFRPDEGGECHMRSDEERERADPFGLCPNCFYSGVQHKDEFGNPRIDPDCAFAAMSACQYASWMDDMDMPDYCYACQDFSPLDDGEGSFDVHCMIMMSHHLARACLHPGMNCGEFGNTCLADQVCCGVEVNGGEGEGDIWTEPACAGYPFGWSDDQCGSFDNAVCGDGGDVCGDGEYCCNSHRPDVAGCVSYGEGCPYVQPLPNCGTQFCHDGFYCCASHNELGEIDDPGFAYCAWEGDGEGYGQECHQRDHSERDPELCMACVGADSALETRGDLFAEGDLCLEIFQARCREDGPNSPGTLCTACAAGNDNPQRRKSCREAVVAYAVDECKPEGEVCGDSQHTRCAWGQTCCGVRSTGAPVCAGGAYRYDAEEYLKDLGFGAPDFPDFALTATKIAAEKAKNFCPSQGSCGDDVCGADEYCCNPQDPSRSECRAVPNADGSNWDEARCDWAGFPPNCGLFNYCDDVEGQTCCGADNDPGFAYCVETDRYDDHCHLRGEDEKQDPVVCEACLSHGVDHDADGGHLAEECLLALAANCADVNPDGTTRPESSKPFYCSPCEEFFKPENWKNEPMWKVCENEVQYYALEKCLPQGPECGAHHQHCLYGQKCCGIDSLDNHGQDAAPVCIGEPFGGQGSNDCADTDTFAYCGESGEQCNEQEFCCNSHRPEFARCVSWNDWHMCEYQPQRPNCGALNTCDDNEWCCGDYSDPGALTCVRGTTASCDFRDHEEQNEEVCWPCFHEGADVSNGVGSECILAVVSQCMFFHENGEGFDGEFDLPRIAGDCGDILNICADGESDGAFFSDDCRRAVTGAAVRQCVTGGQRCGDERCARGQLCCGLDDEGHAICKGEPLGQDNRHVCGWYDDGEGGESNSGGDGRCGDDECRPGSFCCNAHRPELARCVGAYNPGECQEAGPPPNCGRHFCREEEAEVCCMNDSDPGTAYCTHAYETDGEGNPVFECHFRDESETNPGLCMPCFHQGNTNNWNNFNIEGECMGAIMEQCTQGSDTDHVWYCNECFDALFELSQGRKPELSEEQGRRCQGTIVAYLANECLGSGMQCATGHCLPEQVCCGRGEDDNGELGDACYGFPILDFGGNGQCDMDPSVKCGDSLCGEGFFCCNAHDIDNAQCVPLDYSWLCEWTPLPNEGGGGGGGSPLPHIIPGSRCGLGHCWSGQKCCSDPEDAGHSVCVWHGQQCPASLRPDGSTPGRLCQCVGDIFEEDNGGDRLRRALRSVIAERRRLDGEDGEGYDGEDGEDYDGEDGEGRDDDDDDNACLRHFVNLCLAGDASVADACAACNCNGDDCNFEFSGECEAAAFGNFMQCLPAGPDCFGTQCSPFEVCCGTSEGRDGTLVGVCGDGWCGEVDASCFGEKCEYGPRCENDESGGWDAQVCCESAQGCVARGASCPTDGSDVTACGVLPACREDMFCCAYPNDPGFSTCVDHPNQCPDQRDLGKFEELCGTCMHGFVMFNANPHTCDWEGPREANDAELALQVQCSQNMALICEGSTVAEGIPEPCWSCCGEGWDVGMPCAMDVSECEAMQQWGLGLCLPHGEECFGTQCWVGHRCCGQDANGEGVCAPNNGACDVESTCGDDECGLSEKCCGNPDAPETLKCVNRFDLCPTPRERCGARDRCDSGERCCGQRADPGFQECREYVEDCPADRPASIVRPDICPYCFSDDVQGATTCLEASLKACAGNSPPSYCDLCNDAERRSVNGCFTKAKEWARARCVPQEESVCDACIQWDDEIGYHARESDECRTYWKASCDSSGAPAQFCLSCTTAQLANAADRRACKFRVANHLKELCDVDVACTDTHGIKAFAPAFGPTAGGDDIEIQVYGMEPPLSVFWDNGAEPFAWIENPLTTGILSTFTVESLEQVGSQDKVQVTVVDQCGASHSFEFYYKDPQPRIPVANGGLQPSSVFEGDNAEFTMGVQLPSETANADLPEYTVSYYDADGNEVELEAEDPLTGAGGFKHLSTEEVVTASGGFAKNLRFRIRLPDGLAAGEYEIIITFPDGLVGKVFRVNQRVPVLKVIEPKSARVGDEITLTISNIIPAGLTIGGTATVFFENDDYFGSADGVLRAASNGDLLRRVLIDVEVPDLGATATQKLQLSVFFENDLQADMDAGLDAFELFVPPPPSLRDVLGVSGSTTGSYSDGTLAGVRTGGYKLQMVIDNLEVCPVAGDFSATIDGVAAVLSVRAASQSGQCGKLQIAIPEQDDEDTITIVVTHIETGTELTFQLAIFAPTAVLFGQSTSSISTRSAAPQMEIYIKDGGFDYDDLTASVFPRGNEAAIQDAEDVWVDDPSKNPASVTVQLPPVAIADAGWYVVRLEWNGQQVDAEVEFKSPGQVLVAASQFAADAVFVRGGSIVIDVSNIRAFTSTVFTFSDGINDDFEVTDAVAVTTAGTSAASFQMTVPSGLAAGSVSVTAHHSTEPELASSPVTITVVSADAVTFDSITPDFAFTTSQRSVTARMSNFPARVASVIISIDGVETSTLVTNIESDLQEDEEGYYAWVTFQVPTASAGSHTITIADYVITSASASKSFTWIAKAASEEITGATPESLLSCAYCNAAALAEVDFVTLNLKGFDVYDGASLRVVANPLATADPDNHEDLTVESFFLSSGGQIDLKLRRPRSTVAGDTWFGVSLAAASTVNAWFPFTYNEQYPPSITIDSSTARPFIGTGATVKLVAENMHAVPAIYVDDSLVASTVSGAATSVAGTSLKHYTITFSAPNSITEAGDVDLEARIGADVVGTGVLTFRQPTEPAAASIIGSSSVAWNGGVLEVSLSGFFLASPSEVVATFSQGGSVLQDGGADIVVPVTPVSLNAAGAFKVEVNVPELPVSGTVTLTIDDIGAPGNAGEVDFTVEAPAASLRSLPAKLWANAVEAEIAQFRFFSFPFADASDAGSVSVTFGASTDAVSIEFAAATGNEVWLDIGVPTGVAASGSSVSVTIQATNGVRSVSFTTSIAYFVRGASTAAVTEGSSLPTYGGSLSVALSDLSVAWDAAAITIVATTPVTGASVAVTSAQVWENADNVGSFLGSVAATVSPGFGAAASAGSNVDVEFTITDGDNSLTFTVSFFEPPTPLVTTSAAFEVSVNFGGSVSIPISDFPPVGDVFVNIDGALIAVANSAVVVSGGITTVTVFVPAPAAGDTDGVASVTVYSSAAPDLSVTVTVSHVVDRVKIEPAYPGQQMTATVTGRQEIGFMVSNLGVYEADWASTTNKICVFFGNNIGEFQGATRFKNSDNTKVLKVLVRAKAALRQATGQVTVEIFAAASCDSTTKRATAGRIPFTYTRAGAMVVETVTPGSVGELQTGNAVIEMSVKNFAGVINPADVSVTFGTSASAQTRTASTILSDSLDINVRFTIKVPPLVAGTYTLTVFPTGTNSATDRATSTLTVTAPVPVVTFTPGQLREGTSLTIAIEASGIRGITATTTADKFTVEIGGVSSPAVTAGAAYQIPRGGAVKGLRAAIPASLAASSTGYNVRLSVSGQAGGTTAATKLKLLSDDLTFQRVVPTKGADWEVIKIYLGNAAFDANYVDGEFTFNPAVAFSTTVQYTASNADPNLGTLLLKAFIVPGNDGLHNNLQLIYTPTNPAKSGNTMTMALEISNEPSITTFQPTNAANIGGSLGTVGVKFFDPDLPVAGWSVVLGASATSAGYAATVRSAPQSTSTPGVYTISVRLPAMPDVVGSLGVTVTHGGVEATTAGLVNVFEICNFDAFCPTLSDGSGGTQIANRDRIAADPPVSPLCTNNPSKFCFKTPSQPEYRSHSPDSLTAAGGFLTMRARKFWSDATTSQFVVTVAGLTASCTATKITSGTTYSHKLDCQVPDMRSVLDFTGVTQLDDVPVVVSIPSRYPLLQMEFNYIVTKHISGAPVFAASPVSPNEGAVEGGNAVLLKLTNTPVVAESAIAVTFVGTDGSWEGNAKIKIVDSELDALELVVETPVGCNGDQSGCSANVVITLTVSNTDFRTATAAGAFTYLSAAERPIGLRTIYPTTGPDNAATTVAILVRETFADLSLRLEQSGSAIDTLEVASANIKPKVLYIGSDVVHATLLTVAIPAGLAAGAYDLIVVDDVNGRETPVGAMSFTVYEVAVQRVEYLSPNIVEADGGVFVAITIEPPPNGAYSLDICGNDLSIGSGLALVTETASKVAVSATMPACAVGEYFVSLTDDDGPGQDLGQWSKITVIQPDAVADPAVDVTTGGRTVQISIFGTTATAANEITCRFNGVAATSVTNFAAGGANDWSTFDAVVPAGTAAGAITGRVITPSVDAAYETFFDFRYLPKAQIWVPAPSSVTTGPTGPIRTSVDVTLRKFPKVTRQNQVEIKFNTLAQGDLTVPFEIVKSEGVTGETKFRLKMPVYNAPIAVVVTIDPEGIVPPVSFNFEYKRPAAFVSEVTPQSASIQAETVVEVEIPHLIPLALAADGTPDENALVVTYLDGVEYNPSEVLWSDESSTRFRFITPVSEAKPTAATFVTVTRAPDALSSLEQIVEFDFSATDNRVRVVSQSVTTGLGASTTNIALRVQNLDIAKSNAQLKCDNNLEGGLVLDSINDVSDAEFTDYTVQLPAVPATLTYANGKRDVTCEIFNDVDGGVAFTFTFRQRLAFTACRFQDSYGRIECSANQDGDAAGHGFQSFPCSEIFESVVLLGDGAEAATTNCRFTSRSKLLITLQANAAIRPNRADHALAFLADEVAPVLSYSPRTDVSNAAHSVTVGDDPDAPQPVATLKAPTSIPSCDDLELDGSSSSGWQLSYFYSCTNCAAYPELASLSSFLATQSTAKITVSQALLAFENFDYKFKLTVKGAALKTASAEATVTRDGRPIPGIVADASELVVNPNAAAECRITPSPPCADGSDLAAEWVVLSGDGLRQLEDDDWAWGLSSANIKAGVLAAGDHVRLEVRVWPTSDPTNTNSLVCDVSVPRGPLVAIIDGFSQTIAYDEAIVLSGANSHDPADPTAVLEFAWACVDSNGVACRDSSNAPLDISGDIVEIDLPAGTLASGAYQFSLTVGDGERTSTAVVTVVIEEPADGLGFPGRRLAATGAAQTVSLSVSSESPLSVPNAVSYGCLDEAELECFDVRMAGDDKLILVANADASLDFEWTVDPAPANEPLQSDFDYQFGLPPNSLSGGVFYDISVHVSAPCEDADGEDNCDAEVSTSTVRVYVVPSPGPGTLSLSPACDDATIGCEALSQFDVSASGFADTRQPLTYSVSLDIDGEQKYQTSAFTNSFGGISIPVGEVATVTVKVTNSEGASTTESITFDLVQTDASQALLDLLGDGLSGCLTLGDDRVCNQLIVGGGNSLEDDDGDRRLRRRLQEEGAADSLWQALYDSATSSAMTPSSISGTVSALRAVTRNAVQLSDANVDAALEFCTTISGVMAEAQAELSVATDLFVAFTDLRNVALARGDAVSCDLIETANTVRRDISIAMLTEAMTGETATTFSHQGSVLSVRKVASALATTSTFTAGEVSVTLGDAAVLASTTSSIYVAVFSDPYLYPSETVFPNGYASNLQGIAFTDTDGNTIEYDGPVQTTFPLNDALIGREAPRCIGVDESTCPTTPAGWSRDGCSLVSNTAFTATCACTGVTRMAAALGTDCFSNSEDTICSDNGTCDDWEGVCSCINDFTGDDCSVPPGCTVGDWVDFGVCGGAACGGRAGEIAQTRAVDGECDGATTERVDLCETDFCSATSSTARYISATARLTGYANADFGIQQRNQFRNGIAALINGVEETDVMITSQNAAFRRELRADEGRRLQDNVISITFRVELKEEGPTKDVTAESVKNTLTQASTSGALLTSLQDAGLDALTAAELSDAELVTDRAGQQGGPDTEVEEEFTESGGFYGVLAAGAVGIGALGFVGYKVARKASTSGKRKTAARGVSPDAGLSDNVAFQGVLETEDVGGIELAATGKAPSDEASEGGGAAAEGDDAPLVKTEGGDDDAAEGKAADPAEPAEGGDGVEAVEAGETKDDEEDVAREREEPDANTVAASTLPGRIASVSEMDSAQLKAAKEAKVDEIEAVEEGDEGKEDDEGKDGDDDAKEGKDGDDDTDAAVEEAAAKAKAEIKDFAGDDDDVEFV